MRKIKFRGYSVDADKWIYGDLWHRPYAKDCVTIVSFMEDTGTTGGLEVIPETVGQYTGSKDKNGTEIYEGDIVKWSADILVSVWDYELPTQLRLYGTKAVEYKGGAFDPLYVKTGGYFERCENYEVEIIGNIFENPELMEAGKCEKLNLEVFQ